MLVMADVHTSMSSLEMIFFHEPSRKENCKKCFCRLVSNVMIEMVALFSFTVVVIGGWMVLFLVTYFMLLREL